MFTSDKKLYDITITNKRPVCETINNAIKVQFYKVNEFITLNPGDSVKVAAFTDKEFEYYDSYRKIFGIIVSSIIYSGGEFVEGGTASQFPGTPGSSITPNNPVKPPVLMSSIDTLDNLEFSNGILEPEFNVDTISYTITFPIGTDSTVITATPTDTNATVTGVGEIQLTEDTDKIEITVTAEDPEFVKVYTVEVNFQ